MSFPKLVARYKLTEFEYPEKVFHIRSFWL